METIHPQSLITLFQHFKIQKKKKKNNEKFCLIVYTELGYFIEIIPRIEGLARPFVN